MFKELFERMYDGLEILFYIIAVATFIFLLSLTVFYTFSSKHFRGYYLSHMSDGLYRVRINWENAPDETAFKTFDGDKAIEVLKELNKIGYKEACND